MELTPEQYDYAIKHGDEMPVVKEIVAAGKPVDPESVPPSCRPYLGLLGLLKRD